MWKRFLSHLHLIAMQSSRKSRRSLPLSVCSCSLSCLHFRKGTLAFLIIFFSLPFLHVLRSIMPTVPIIIIIIISLLYSHRPCISDPLGWFTHIWWWMLFAMCTYLCNIMRNLLTYGNKQGQKMSKEMRDLNH